MARQTEEREELYARRDPPGEPIPCNVARPRLKDGPPPDEELRAAVKKLRNGRTGGGSTIGAEDVKGWLFGIEREERARKEGVEGQEGAGDSWCLFVQLIQHIWETRDIPRQMLLTILVLILKGGGDYRGIGLLEVAWKVIEGVVDGRLKGVAFHDSLHGFREKRGCGTGIMEVKLTQQLAFIEQCPLYGIFLDLCKTYDVMDRSRCLLILKDRGVGFKTFRLIQRFWDKGILICRASGCYGEPFKAKRGVTQDRPVSPTIFNLMVDAVIWEWERQLLLKGFTLNKVCVLVAIFYADDCLIASRDHKTLKTAIGLLTGLFDRVGLETNTKKTEVMVFLPGRVRTSLSEAAYKARMDKDFRGEHKGRKVECGECGMLLVVGYLAGHQASQHDIYQSFALEEDQGGAPPSPRRWTATHLPEEDCYPCPVLGCPQGQAGRGAQNLWNLRWHFAYRHPQDTLRAGRMCFEKCRLCGMQVSTAGKPSHETSKTCRNMTAARRQHAVTAQGKGALRQFFTAYGEPLRQVSQFKYLGRVVSCEDNNTPAVRRNIKQA